MFYFRKNIHMQLYHDKPIEFTTRVLEQNVNLCNLLKQ